MITGHANGFILDPIDPGTGNPYPNWETRAADLADLGPGDRYFYFHEVDTDADGWIGTVTFTLLGRPALGDFDLAGQEEWAYGSLLSPLAISFSSGMPEGHVSWPPPYYYTVNAERRLLNVYSGLVDAGGAGSVHIEWTGLGGMNSVVESLTFTTGPAAPVGGWVIGEIRV